MTDDRCTCQTSDLNRLSCPEHGVESGWAVLTQHSDGTWKIDWDAEFHTNEDAAYYALKEARETGCTAVLFRLIPEDERSSAEMAQRG